MPVVIAVAMQVILHDWNSAVNLFDVYGYDLVYEISFQSCDGTLDSLSSCSRSDDLVVFIHTLLLYFYGYPIPIRPRCPLFVPWSVYGRSHFSLLKTEQPPT